MSAPTTSPLQATISTPAPQQASGSASTMSSSSSSESIPNFRQGSSIHSRPAHSQASQVPQGLDANRRSSVGGQQNSTETQQTTAVQNGRAWKSKFAIGMVITGIALTVISTIGLVVASFSSGAIALFPYSLGLIGGVALAIAVIIFNIGKSPSSEDGNLNRAGNNGGSNNNNNSSHARNPLPNHSNNNENNVMSHHANDADNHADDIDEEDEENIVESRGSGVSDSVKNEEENKEPVEEKKE